VIGKLITYAADARLLDSIRSSLAAAPTWPSAWGLSPAQAGALFLLVAQALEKAGQTESAQAFLIR
jgi:hypothetical protein